jgi:hypothetical protein
MAMINVNRGATSLGIFSEEDIRAGLSTGRFAPTDLGWREGMTSWQTLAQFPEFAGAIGIAAPATGATYAPGSVIPTSTPTRTGLPWENRQQLGLVKAFTDTLIMVLGMMGGGRNNPLGAMFGAGIGMIFLIILAPILVAVSMFIGAGIIHLCLMLVGGAKRSFETTFRVVCFASGSAQTLLIVPFCGGVISGIWGLIAECIGLARAHETETGRAVLAVLLPVIICCGGGFLCAIMFGFMGAMSSHH